MKKNILTFLLFILFITVFNGQEVVRLAAIENSINSEEANVKGMKLGNEAKIIWSEKYKEKQSPIAFVYLHGFGASGREGEPVMSMLSKNYNANIYVSRLKEHGLDRDDNFINLTPENYIASAKEVPKPSYIFRIDNVFSVYRT